MLFVFLWALSHRVFTWMKQNAGLFKKGAFLAFILASFRSLKIKRSQFISLLLLPNQGGEKALFLFWVLAIPSWWQNVRNKIAWFRNECTLLAKLALAKNFRKTNRTKCSSLYFCVDNTGNKLCHPCSVCTVNVSRVLLPIYQRSKYFSFFSALS